MRLVAVEVTGDGEAEVFEGAVDRLAADVVLLREGQDRAPIPRKRPGMRATIRMIWRFRRTVRPYAESGMAVEPS